MALEIERKFLVADESWRGAVESELRIVQGYLAVTERSTIRVRIQGSDAMVAIKGPRRGIVRSEYEYPIPLEDAWAMLQELPSLPLIDKVRYRVRCGSHAWDLDVFGGDNAGLAVAEIELEHPEEVFELPAWAGSEVTGDPRYANASLARCPFRHW